MGRGDVVGIAGEDNQLRAGDLLLPSAHRGDRAEPALLGGHDQGRALDLGNVGSDVGAGDRRHKAELGRQRGTRHVLDPEVKPLFRESAAKPVGHVLPGPVFDSVILKHLDGLGHLFGDPLAERRRRADHGQGLDPLRPARGEGASDRAADLGADQMEPVDAEMVHQ